MLHLEITYHSLDIRTSSSAFSLKVPAAHFLPLPQLTMDALPGYFNGEQL